MPSPLRPDQIEHILKLYKVYLRKGYTQEQACEEIGQLYQRSPATIRTFATRLLADTTNLAQSYFKANAFKMATRVVREGSVAQVMDVLERPNIGVLAPKKGASEGSRGFFLTVSADSCGAVKVNAAIIEGNPGSEVEPVGEDDQLWAQTQKQLKGEEDFSVIEMVPEEHKDSLGRRSFAKTPEGRERMSEITQQPRGPGKSPTYLAAVERARKRLADAKET